MVNFGPLLRTYTSQREVVYARRGMVCTTQPLASQAGLAMLKKGGNAMGRGQIIWRKENGVLVGGTEKRADGAIACW